MCGIWGYVGHDGTVDAADAWNGLRSLTDRGPDDWGMYFNDDGKVTAETALPAGSRSVAIGNRRLSILDISAAGNQPMQTDDGLWIVYNGEVYNYKEIREDLRDSGYAFESDTDTEVVLKAFREYGPECVERFRGMFAFAVYDEHMGTVFAARDRFGIKPFYYARTDDGLAFASEVTALLSGDVVERELDPEGVDGFLAFGYVPGRRTILSEVRSLPPGTTLTFNEESGAVEIDRYYNLEFNENATVSAEQLHDLLAESVRLRLRSDVPVGAFLSGGLDSSAVAALLCEETKDDADVRTYSIGFEEPEYSEVDFAQEVATALGTDHTTESITGSRVRDRLDDIFDAMDQPTADGVNTYFVSQVAADDGLKVALSGLGSDELLYGYPTFEEVERYYRWIRRFHAVPEPIRNATATIVERIGQRLDDRPTEKVAQTLESRSAFGAAYLLSRGLFPRESRSRLTTDFVPTRDWTTDLERTNRGDDYERSTTEAVSSAELSWYMHDQLLRDTDAMSMSQSLEVRVPFLDSELADYALSLPEDAKKGREKQLLKDAVAGDVPRSVLEREKSGFVFPFGEWLRDDLSDRLEKAFRADDRLRRAGLEPDAVRHVERSFQEGKVHWSRPWSLFVLVQWVDRHLSRE